MFAAQSTDGSLWNRTYKDANEAAWKLRGHCKSGYVRQLGSNAIIWIVYNGRILRPEKWHEIEMDRQTREQIYKLLNPVANVQRQRWRRAK